MEKLKQHTKKYFRRNRLSCIISIIFFSLLFLYMKCNYKELNSIEKLDTGENLYNLLTMNTIFAGFLYTMLGNMVEFTTRPLIREKDKAGYIDKYFSPIYFGLFYFVSSIVIEVLLIFFNIHIFVGFVLLIQKSFSVIGILYFIISTLMVKKMISQTRKNN